MSEIEHDAAGVASGVVNAAYQIGGALGLAIVTTLSTTRFDDLARSVHGVPDAAVGGFHLGLLIAAAMAAVNIALTFVGPRIRPTAEMVTEATVGV